MKLDKQTRKQLKLYKLAKKIERKLRTRKGSKQQRDSWKQIMAKAYHAFPTKEELKMRPYMAEIGFKDQVPLCGYIADFASDRYSIIVEIDGPIHANQRAYDSFRDRIMHDSGWRVLRFTNEQVNRDAKAVADAVLDAV